MVAPGQKIEGSLSRDVPTNKNGEPPPPPAVTLRRKEIAEEKLITRGLTFCGDKFIPRRAKSEQRNAASQVMWSPTTINQISPITNGSELARQNGFEPILAKPLPLDNNLHVGPTSILQSPRPPTTPPKPQAAEKSVKLKPFTKKEKEDWLNGHPTKGFIRVFDPNSNLQCSVVVPCSLGTSCQHIAARLGFEPNEFHVQYNGDQLKRLRPTDCPLKLQDSYLTTIGITDTSRRQELGDLIELGYFVRIFAGRPATDEGFGLEALSAQCHVKMGKVFSTWTRKLCVLSDSRLMIYQGLDRSKSPTIIPLTRANIEEIQLRSRGKCIKCSSSSRNGFPTAYLSFDTPAELTLWIGRCIKAAAKVPPISDLSNLHLERLPDQVFCIGSERLLTQLNLKRNCLKSRPLNADSTSIGWLEDLPRLQSLRVLNLADNVLKKFPPALLELSALTDLNVAGNRLRVLPEEISALRNLRVLNLQNNHLSHLPKSLAALNLLNSVDLSFNQFTAIPLPFIDLTTVDQWILSGNRFDQQFVPVDQLYLLSHVRKIELRHSGLALFQSGILPLGVLPHLTHLDIRDNIPSKLEHLDLRSLASLQILHCQRNVISCLELNGASLNYIFAANNCIKTFMIMPVPHNLKLLDLSHNCLTKLPEWLADLSKIEKILASHNRIALIPARLFTNVATLRYLDMNHNDIRVLPGQIENCLIETLILHHNKISVLPDEFLASAHRLRVLNLAQNMLTEIPALNTFQDLNKVQTLILAANRLTDSVFSVVSGYRRLKRLDLSFNLIRELDSSAIERLTAMEELNVSGNKITNLPTAIVSLMPNLVILRAHSNRLSSLPDFTNCENLKVLDVGSNQLEMVNVKCVQAPQLLHLDLSCNPRLKLDAGAFKEIRSERLVSLIDMNRELQSPAPTEVTSTEVPWQAGFSETSGDRNKLCITQIRQTIFNDDIKDALFGIIDGGLNNGIPLKLQTLLPTSVKEELSRNTNDPAKPTHLKYSFLMAHKSMKANGQKLGASCALCHIQPCETPKNGSLPSGYVLHAANVGHVEAVLCRDGQPLLVSQKCTLDAQRNSVDEYSRIRSAGGILTEDNEISGITQCSRLLGCSFLYPMVIPDPFTVSLPLGDTDEFLVIASKGLWEVMDYNEVVARIRRVANPILAAKHLQDVAQAYGSRENISILVVRFFFDPKLPGCDPGESPGVSGYTSTLSRPKKLGHAASALNLYDSKVEGHDSDQFNESDSDDAQSEPQGKEKLSRDPPNYYFDYKRKLKELLPDEVSEIASQMSSVLTLVPDKPENQAQCNSKDDDRMDDFEDNGPEGFDALDGGIGPVFQWSQSELRGVAMGLADSLENLRLGKRLVRTRKSDSSSSSGLGKSESTGSPHNSSCERTAEPLTLFAKKYDDSNLARSEFAENFNKTEGFIPAPENQTIKSVYVKKCKMKRLSSNATSIVDNDRSVSVMTAVPDAKVYHHQPQNEETEYLAPRTWNTKITPSFKDRQEAKPSVQARSSSGRYFDRFDQVVLRATSGHDYRRNAKRSESASCNRRNTVHEYDLPIVTRNQSGPKSGALGQNGPIWPGRGPIICHTLGFQPSLRETHLSRGEVLFSKSEAPHNSSSLRRQNVVFVPSMTFIRSDLNGAQTASSGGHEQWSNNNNVSYHYRSRSIGSYGQNNRLRPHSVHGEVISSTLQRNANGNKFSPNSTKNFAGTNTLTKFCDSIYM